ncbi:Sodium/sulfate symporter [Schizophyllum commune H4-8]|uniref:Sodium/sulfate symporter n=1 Tax=Schizophyllum commune (strain H4-8 / FGSC 9210) TaxID=578458 RepID=UPI00215EBB17|nr:Sodium/sulfate symporter [Schizophyllum commune H4-8]KAI5886234.1 Sodium/sulfate symporter [Schizophyllum commune H4-8]
MKFSSALKFNAVSEWWDEYIAYDTLKKFIYQLEKQQHDLDQSYHDLEAHERTSLVGERTSHTDDLFIPLLDRELRKIVAFYEHQEQELFRDLAELEEMVKQQDEEGLQGDHYADDAYEGDESDDDDSPVRSRTRSTGRRRSTSGAYRRPNLSVTVGPAEAIPEDAPLSPPFDARRYSHSSEDHDRGLEDSLISLPGKSGALGKARTLANRIVNLKDSVTSAGSASETIWNSRSNYATDTRLLYKRRITALFTSFTSLKSYVEVNYSGFRKILKKYDKVTYSELLPRYLHDVVDHAKPFTPAAKERIQDALERLYDLYAKCVSHGDRATAKQQLRLHKREHIAWERDTVWRQMIGRARRGDSDTERAPGAVLVKEPPPPLFAIPTPIGRLRITKGTIASFVALLVFIVLLNTQTVDGDEANRCFAILVFATILWATEAIPLFVTSLLVPLLLVCLRVIRNEEGERLEPPAATKYVFSIMFSPTIMLLIGGFTISSALSKTSIDRLLITRVLSLAGTRPRTVLLAFMGVSCFASMWISNVAAPTLCFTLIRPILRTLPPKAPFGPCLILAIALAANIGGQSSPISSPQNLIALQAMEPPLDWGSWFAVALPVSAISIIVIWLFLLVSYKPARSPDGECDLEIKTIRPTKERFTGKQYWVSFVCLGTIALWCVEHSIEQYVGDMGVIAIIPVVAFFGTGVLKKDDFEQFAWTIVFLAMGGIALGKGVTTSGLLEVMDGLIRDMVEGLSLYNVVLILSPVVLVISTFISHTIASVLLVPIAKEVGSNLPGNHQNLLIFITGLICSTGMGMPVSGFPNQTAATQEDEMGDLYLSNIDFLKNGVPASIIATLVVSTIGFLLMKAIGM